MDSVACSVRLDCTGLVVAQRQAALRVVRLTGSSHVTVVLLAMAGGSAQPKLPRVRKRQRRLFFIGNAGARPLVLPASQPE